MSYCVVTEIGPGYDAIALLDTRLGNVEGKYVRSTRFVSIAGPATSGSVTLPALSEVVLDDFGGTTDAVISGLDPVSGRPTDQGIKDTLGNALATTFDSSGNFTLSGTPVSFPVALIYRVRQKLADFDSTSPDLIGGLAIEQVSGGGEAGAWGTITGTLSDQLDLQAALNAKENTANKGASNGYAPLDGDADVPDANISPIVNRPAHIGFETIPTIQDNGDGTITVLTANVTFYIDGNKSKIQTKSLAQTTLTMTDGVTNFIVADGLNNNFAVLLSHGSIDMYQYIPLAEIFRSGSNLHTQLLPMDGRRYQEFDYNRVADAERYVREFGLDGMAVDSSLKLTATSGVVYAVNTEYAIATISPASRGFFNYHSAGVWNRTTALNLSLNNSQYDDGTNLQSLTAGYYNINWIFRGIESQDHWYYVLSDAQYSNLDLAKAAGLPASLPDIITSHTMLIGRVIIQQGATTGFTIQSAFGQTFSNSSPVTQHNSLAGIQGGALNNYWHMSVAESNYQLTSGMTSYQPVASMTNFLNTSVSSKFAGISTAGTNISLTLNTAGLAASVAAQSVQPVAASAANGSFLFSTLSHANSNNVSFSTGTQGIYASASFPAQTTQPVAASAANGSFLFSTLSHANSNNVSFSTGTQGIYASASFPAQTVQPVAASAANGSFNFSTLSHANSNNVSFSTGTQGIYASASFPAQTTQPVAVSAGNGSFAFSTLSFANSNGLTFSTGTQGLYGSHNALTQQSTQPVAYSAANGSAAFSTLSFAASNNVTFSSGTQGLYATASFPSQTVQPVAVSAANGSFNFSTLSHANSNGISFSTGTQGLYASHNGITQQSTQPVAVSAANGSVAFSTLSFANSNGLSFSTGTQGVYGSHNGITQQSTQPVAVSAANGSFGFSTLSFANSNGVSFSTGTQGIYASIQPGAAAGIAALAADGSTTYTSGTVVFVPGANISMSTNGQSISIIGPNPAGSVTPAFSAANGSATFSTLSFANSNNVSFSTGTQGLYATASFPAQSVQPVAVSGSNGSFNFSTMSLQGSNGISFYTSNGSLVGSVDNFVDAVIGLGANGTGTFQTSVSFAAGNNVTLSTGANVISIHAPAGGGGPTLSRWLPVNPPMNMSTIAHSNGTLMFSPLYADGNYSFTRGDIFASISFTTQTNTSVTSGTISVSKALYSWNASTWSQMVSGSQSFSFSNSSNANTTNYFGVREITIPMATNVTPGNYMLAWWIRTSGHTMTFAPLVASALTNGYSGPWGAASNTSVQLMPGLGISSVSMSSAMPTAINQTLIQGNVAGAQRWPLVEFVSDNL